MNIITKEEVIGLTEELFADESIETSYLLGMTHALGLVTEFNVIGGQELHYEPVVVSEESANLSIDLLQEELDELKEAYQKQDVVAQLDAMIDLFYVLGGVILKSGLGAEFVQGFLQVHKNNMEKYPNGVCTKNEKGKIIKPEGFKNIDLGDNFPHLREI